MAPQYREVIAENYSTQTDRPDYSLTLRGVTKFFVEAKKPSVDIFRVSEPAFQARKYGWNAKHKITVLTNFEYLIIYDTTSVPKEGENCANRSVVTTPTEIVKYMVEKTMSLLCKDKTPKEIFSLRIADIACGSGIFFEEVFSYLQAHCVDWYIENDQDHLIEIGNGRYKLLLQEKKELLCSCVFGIDIDVHAVEVAKFSLLIKLIEDETAPSVSDVMPILPDLSTNIYHGNALVSTKELKGQNVSQEQHLAL